MYPIEFRNLVKTFGSFKAVDDLNFHLNEGEIFALLGPNGAGKTTTISVLSTLEKATSGQIYVYEKELLSHSYQIKSLLGIVPQEILSSGFFTVEELLRFQAGYYNIKNNQGWIDYVLDRLELSSHRSKVASRLSGGYKRRVMIAKALVHKPKILVLDEPTAGVDIDLRQKLWEFITELNQEGMTILLTTHYLEEAEKLCDRIGILHLGQLLKVDETQALIDAYTSREITFVFKKSIPKLSSSYMISQEEDRVKLTVPRSVGIGDLIKETGIHWELLKDIKIKEGILEDAFRAIIQEVK